MAARQIVRSVNGSLGSGRSHVNIQLVPESLGRVSIQLKMANNVLSAQITAQHESTKALLEQNLSSLRAAFDEQGIKVDRLVISRDTFDMKNQEQDKDARSSGRYTKSGGEDNGQSKQKGRDQENERSPYNPGRWNERLSAMDYFF